MQIENENKGFVTEENGRQISEQESNKSVMAEAIGKKEIQQAAEVLKKYKAAKASLEKRIIENEQWYKMRHWSIMRNKQAKAREEAPEPTSGWLFNAVANKHADAMDNFPEPNVLPREKMDQQDATILGSIIPVIMERNDFEETYSDVWWYKLKNGTGVYGVFWDNSLENGLGDIHIRKLDLLNMFWEPGITDIQQSRNLFIVDLVDNDMLEGEYPKLKGKLNSKVIDIAEYVYDDTVDTSGKSVVVDWYYKKQIGEHKVLHYCKFVGNEVLYSSENDIEMNETGWYLHGEYPIVFDVLYPEESTPVGFGYIDICKDPQMYIDKLNQIIIENSLQAGRARYFVKDNASINLEDFKDWSKQFIPVAGSVNEDNIRPIDVKQLDSGIVSLMQYKVDEMKETSGNRDVNQGSASGVTAAAAISALQEAGNKLSRDIIKASYRSYAKINYLCIELIRQFYNFQRTFRIRGLNGAFEYIEYSNANIIAQQAAMGMGIVGSRKPIFDIKIKPQKSNPFSRMSHNELAKELYNSGFFNPELAGQALQALDMMDFEGKESVIEKIQKSQMEFQMQQIQAAMGGLQLQGQVMPQGEGSKGSSIPADGGIAGAVSNATTPYAQKMAERARASVNISPDGKFAP